ncbi:hypothetical protein VU05_03290 [Desulfobulbus sp. F1]|nr:hypothetical protein [Desulfobulbus sp. F1]
MEKDISLAKSVTEEESARKANAAIAAEQANCDATFAMELARFDTPFPLHALHEAISYSPNL